MARRDTVTFSRGHRFETPSPAPPPAPGVLTSLQETPPAIQAAVPALVAELVAALEQAEAHGLAQGLGQARLASTQPLLPPRQHHLLALLQVGLARRRLVGEVARQEDQGLPPCQSRRRHREKIQIKYPHTLKA